MKKPYCVACPQAALSGLFGLMAFSFLLPGLWVVSVICVAVGLLSIVRFIRGIIFCRISSSILFSLLAAVCIRMICISDEAWDTTPHCEDDVPVWNGGGRKDPCGEKPLYLLLAFGFVFLAVMPWLPPGNRYYRSLMNERDNVRGNETKIDEEEAERLREKALASDWSQSYSGVGPIREW